MISNKSPFFKKLSSKISLSIFAGTLLSVVFIGLLAFLFTKAALQRSIMDQQIGLAKQTMSKVDRLLYERITDIQQIAGEDGIEKFVIEHNNGGAEPDPNLRAELIKRMNELIVVTGPWDVLFVVDKNGKILLSADEPLLGGFIYDYPAKAAAYKASIQGNAYYSDLVVSKDTGLPNIIFSAPIRDGKDRSSPVAGVVIGGFSWPAALEILSDSRTNAVLLNKEGRVIGSGQLMAEPQAIADNLKNGTIFPQFIGVPSGSIILPKGTGTQPEEALASIAVQTGYLSYKGNGWGLLLEEPTAKVFSSATQTAVRLVILLALIGTLTPLTILFIILRQVVRPILVLNRAIHAIAAGDLAQRVFIKSEDEIGMLADSLNKMTGQLQKIHGSLETKVAERTKELEVSQFRVQNILDTASDAIISIDEGRRIILFNKQAVQIFGYEPAEILGRSLETLLPERFRARHPEYVRQFAAKDISNQEMSQRPELYGLRKDGKEFPLMITLSKVKVEAKFIMTAIVRDVSEKNKLEAQLLQSQKMETVGTLAGGIAHDLNNQLTPVKGYIDMILSDTPPGDPNRPLLEEMNVSVERCAEVIHRLMSFSRSSTQKKTIISIPKVFQELKGLLERFLPSTIRLEILCPDDVYPVEGNMTELETVFMNLGANARDAMPKGGNLVFEVRNVDLTDGMLKPGLRKGEYVLVSVRDSGSGIAPEVLNRIFEPFFTTKEKGEGTGLGLAMVFKVIQGFGGWIDVSSQVGKGTTFQVYLPGKPGAPVDELKGAFVVLDTLVGKNEMILFADDEPTIRKMGKVMLENLGYQVWLCSDGQEAVSVYRDNHPKIHALILDMTMPNLTGKQAMQKIFEINPKAKVILASGYTVEGSAQDLIKLGAADFMQKPYAVVSLAKILRAVLGGS